MTMPFFKVQSTQGSARTGTLHTAHGDVPTPAFMPVATQGSVKALDPEDLRSVGASILLSNAYHLYLRPGVRIVEDLGGIHGFMGWDGPVLTDSGGFQGFSLEHLREITEDAIIFKSHIDGSTHTFTPEAAVHHQERLGADIIMPLDMCVSARAERPEVEDAMERTSRWALRSREAHSRAGQALFGIVQGGLHPDLRERSAEYLVSLDFPGYGVGGLSVGESKQETYDAVELTTGLLPAGAPRHLMGVGSPEDVVEAVARGIDLFDCVLPTRIARNGALLVPSGRANVDTAPFKNRDAPVQEDCDCYTCRTFSAAYLHHLFRAKELLAYRLATIHNLRFLLRMLEEIRAAIIRGEFESYRARFHADFEPPDEETRRTQKQKWLRAQGRPGILED